MLEKICIGGAQLGLKYGISNVNGKTLYSDAQKIFSLAQEQKIHTIDTAPGYGDSESSIGSHNLSSDWQIITKTNSYKSKGLKYSRKHLLNSFSASLQNLQKKNIYGILIHSFDDLNLNDNEIYKTLMELKEAGLVKKIGISVYNSRQIDYILDHFHFDIIQLPINILDQRLLLNDYLGKIKKRNIEIHARSIFLQGLLLMDKKDINPFFNPIIKNLNMIKTHAEDCGVTNLAFLLSFIFSIEKIDKIIIGINNFDQFKEIVYSCKEILLNYNFSQFKLYDEKFLNPSNWVI